VTHNRSSEELQMRELIVPKLRELWPAARIIHELPLRYSTNRIDLAAVTPDKIISVEIKSSKDVADRLEAQLRGFLPISTYVIVALAPKWNVKLPTVAKPNKWGGTTYTPQYTEAQEIIRRVGSRIETWTVDAEAGTVEAPDWGGWRDKFYHLPWLSRMLDMLHVAELEQIAARHRCWSGKRPVHDVLVEACNSLMTGREIVAAVCAALRARDAFAVGTDAPIREAA
jgi:hypothetical protein